MSALRAGVLFDLDGTLVDTNYLHTLAWSRALHDGGQWAPMNAIHRLIGMGGDQFLPELLGHEDDAVSAARPKRYRELWPEIRPFPGAADLLRRTRAAGLAVVLATSSPADELDAPLEALGAGDVIDAQTTADDVGKSKPAPDVFVVAMRTGGVDPGRVIAVGDTNWDIEAARSAGIDCVALESGGFSRHELTRAGALRVYRDSAELLEDFDESPLAALLASSPGRS